MNIDYIYEKSSGSLPIDTLLNFGALFTEHVYKVSFCAHDSFLSSFQLQNYLVKVDSLGGRIVSGL